jgi:2-aminoadipate transaminase
VVLCESPTYLAAISAFKAYCVNFVEVPTDDDGMLPDELDRILDTTDRVKVIYTIPDFQNPTGRTWSEERRKRLVAAAKKHNVVVIEDNPYGELRFAGDEVASVKSLDETGCVVSFGTFSKIFCPGYRIAWVAADKEVIQKYILVKQGADLQCNTLAQREIAKYLELNDIDKHIDIIRSVYRKRCGLMVKTMEEEFPAGVKFTRPQGGLFAWVELPDNINARDVLEKLGLNNDDNSHPDTLFNRLSERIGPSKASVITDDIQELIGEGYSELELTEMVAVLADTYNMFQLRDQIPIYVQQLNKQQKAA